MTPRFYILKEEGIEKVRHYVTPEPEETRNALNAMKWGMKKGTVCLITPIRTCITYWEV